MNWYVAKWIIGDRKFVDDWSNPPLNNIKERRRRCCLWLSIHSTTGPMFERNMTFCFYLKMSGFYIRLGKWRWDWKCDAWCQIQFCLLQLWNLEIASLEYRKTFVFYSQWRNTCKLFFSIHTNQRYSGVSCGEDVNLTDPFDNRIGQPWDEFLLIFDFDPILLNCQ